MNIGEKFYCSRCMREVDNEGICRHCGYDPNQPAGRIALEEGTLLQNGRYQLGAVIGMGALALPTLPGILLYPALSLLKNIFLRISAREISMRATR